MKRFVEENDLQQIDLGDNDWVKIPTKISYGLLENLGDLKEANLEKTGRFLVSVIKEWNFVNNNDEIPPINLENVKKLDVNTIQQIVDKVLPLISAEKKI